MKLHHAAWALLVFGALLYVAENSTASFPGHATLSGIAGSIEGVSPSPFQAGTTFLLLGGGILAYHHFA